MSFIDPDTPALQHVFADLVGVSQQAVSTRVRAGQLKENGTYREWLQAYCEKLRRESAWRGGEDQSGLVSARTAEARASADLKELQIKQRIGELVPVSEIEPRLRAMVAAARTELLVLPGVLAQELRALHGIEIDPKIIEDRIHEALSHLATSLASAPEPANDEE